MLVQTTPPFPRHTRHGFSLVEIVVTLLVVGILSAIAYTSLQFFQGETRERSALMSLESVASAQESYFLSRGQWATGEDSLLDFGSELSVSGDASSGGNVVSVSAITYQGDAALGLAVLADTGVCLTLILTSPSQGLTQEPVRRELTGLQPCNGSLAGT